jgi:hypothetical protein
MVGKVEVTPILWTGFGPPLGGIHCSFPVRGLELGWRQIVQGRVDPLGLVHVLNEMAGPLIDIAEALVISQRCFRGNC